jgi:alkylation response protein AidB-like acyl-CoA dehydrogenase
VHASLLLVLAQTDPAAQPPKRGLALMIVEPKRNAGVTRGAPFEKMAFECVDTCEINFDGVRVSDDSVLGGVPGRGLSQLLDGLEIGRLAIASSAVGLAVAALDEAISFAKQRTAFGSAIMQHQAIRLRVAEMATEIESARALTARAAEMVQGGTPGNFTAMAKLAASEMALHVTTDSLRIHGGSGYIRGVMAERLFREAPLYIVGEGTNDILKLGIARSLFDD